MFVENLLFSQIAIKILKVETRSFDILIKFVSFYDDVLKRDSYKDMRIMNPNVDFLILIGMGREYDVLVIDWFRSWW